ncbi:MAG: glycerol dehydrogenase, partial [Clostridia bacterium]|nr:glycerol dehydrogenase [Clostridia bacterium]
GIQWIKEAFCGECTEKEIGRLTEIGKAEGIKAVVGIGGGKAIDAAKVVASNLHTPVGIIPTVASTDAPTSTVSVIYDEWGEFSHYVRFKRNPDIVLVDTEIIAKAPLRYLAAGIGGALGIYYEAEACYKSGAITIAGGRPSLLAAQCAKTIGDVLFTYGRMAKVSCEMGIWSPAIEKVVESSLLFSGIGFESGGLALAHSIYHGYRNLGGKDKMHGEVVAFGALVQMVLEGRSEEEITCICRFCKDMKLPYRLEDIGIDRQNIQKINELSKIAWEQGTALNMHCDVNPDKISAAVLLADYLGRNTT